MIRQLADFRAGNRDSVVMMPYATSSEASLTDAAAVGETVAVRTEKVAVTPKADSYLTDVPAPGAQVLVKETPRAPWRVDASLGRTGAFRLGGLASITFTIMLIAERPFDGSAECAATPVVRIFHRAMPLCATTG